MRPRGTSSLCANGHPIPSSEAGASYFVSEKILTESDIEKMKSDWRERYKG